MYVGDAYLTGIDIAIMLVSLIVMTGLILFLSKSWTGNALRATAQDPEAASQMGIDVARMRQLAFGLAGALGAIAGVLVSMYYMSVFPQMGIPYGFKGFAAALLGGLSSIPGAIVGGLLLGVLESLASGYVGEGYRDMIAYSILLVVLMLRPQGLLGSRSLRRARRRVWRDRRNTDDLDHRAMSRGPRGRQGHGLRRTLAGAAGRDRGCEPAAVDDRIRISTSGWRPGSHVRDDGDQLDDPHRIGWCRLDRSRGLLRRRGLCCGAEHHAPGRSPRRGRSSRPASSPPASPSSSTGRRSGWPAIRSRWPRWQSARSFI